MLLTGPNVRKQTLIAKNISIFISQKAKVQLLMKTFYN